MMNDIMVDLETMDSVGSSAISDSDSNEVYYTQFLTIEYREFNYA